MNFRMMKRGGFLAAAAILAAGCQSASLEDAAPTGAAASGEQSQFRAISPIPLPQNSGPQLAQQEFVSRGIASGGEYPNIGTERKAALPQLSDSEAQRLQNEFARARAETGSGGNTAAEYRRRLEANRRLAATHASEVEAELAE